MHTMNKIALVLGYLTMLNTIALLVLIFGNKAIDWLERRLKGGDKQ